MLNFWLEVPMLSLLAGSAMAQVAPSSQFTEDLGLVLDPTASPLTANGVGAPTLAWDAVDGFYTMFFETRVGDADAVCPSGYWGIGVASSQDGVTWDIWDQLVVTPTPATPFACVAAHPAVVYDAGTYHLWFKAEQGATEANGSPLVERGWGTNNYSGVAYGTVALSLDDKTADIAAIDAAILALEASLDTRVLAFDAMMDALYADLLAQEDEFVCLPSAPLCAPCGSVTMAVFQQGAGATTSSKDFCQPFTFEVPSTLNLTGSGLTANDFARLLWTYDGGGGNDNCRERLINGSLTYTCTNGHVPGDSITTSSVSLRGQVGSSATTQLFANVTLNASNTGTMTYDGPIFATFDDMDPFSSAPDPNGVLSRLNGMITQLNTLIDWLDNFPVTPDEQVLLDEATALRTEARSLRTFIRNTNTQLTSLQNQRATLLAYTQFVTPNVLSSSVAVQVNQTIGYPSVGKLGGQWVMLVQRYPDLFRAVGATPSALTLDATASLTHGTTTWANTEIFEPALYCDPGSAFEYGSWVAGRSNVRGVLSAAGASDAVSTNAVSWLLNTTADFGWNNADDYRHFDVISDAAGELRMYWVQRVGGINEIHLKSTTATWDPADTLNRVCAAVP